MFSNGTHLRVQRRWVAQAHGDSLALCAACTQLTLTLRNAARVNAYAYADVCAP